MVLYNPLLVKKLEEHLKEDPASRSFCSLAQIYCSQGELEKAEKMCLEGLVYNPTYSQAYVILAGIYRGQGHIQKAIKCLTKAKELNPDNPNIYKNLGEIYKKQKDMEKTLNAYKMVALLKPGDRTARDTVQHLEKVIGKGLTVSKQTKPGEKQTLRTLSEKESQKLAKLNKVLARVEIYMGQQTKDV